MTTALKHFFLASLIIFFANKSFAQNCALGQSASSAFPVCGVSTFTQTEVKHCDGNPLPVPVMMVHLTGILMHSGTALPVIFPEILFSV